MKLNCPYCSAYPQSSSVFRTFRKTGSFYRKSDGKRIQRFSCLRCQRSFSRATFHPCFGQKKRNKNHPTLKLLSAGVSLRESARVLKVNRKTVARKLLFLGIRSRQACFEALRSRPLATAVQFDDLETFEHTKCKPLSVTLMVEEKTRFILGLTVSRMPAKGVLASLSRRKYGFRKDERKQKRRELFRELKPFVQEKASIVSDSNPHYAPDVRSFFPRATYGTVLGGRGAITGQGELKKLKRDPLFSLNHTCAMFRAHVSRLIRKTWNTTKDPARLHDHLWCYALIHNQRLKSTA